jgi:hypothetical protein
MALKNVDINRLIVGKEPKDKWETKIEAVGQD